MRPQPIISIKSHVDKRAWTVKEWCEETALSRATVNRMIAARGIKSVTIGRARRIITSPDAVLRSLDDASAA